ncbi:MAG: prepilin-type N-terminal cleavage/methylation domain-containing protein [Candidatus Levybacteria bacterium]|nr:prepilin-type N-terminal cleavage/methylation domain-containing protein [Candidatus Levybacteria bacterium]
MRIFKNKKGFTLVELLLYMGIFSILLTVTLQMFGSVFEFQLESQAVSSVDVDGKFIVNRFNYDVNRASSITLPVALGANNSSLTIVVNNQSLTYSLSDGDINLNNASTGTTDQLNSAETTASDLSFTRLEGSAGKDLIQMSFTLTSEVTQRKGKEVRSFQTTGGLR